MLTARGVTQQVVFFRYLSTWKPFLLTSPWCSCPKPVLSVLVRRYSWGFILYYQQSIKACCVKPSPIYKNQQGSARPHLHAAHNWVRSAVVTAELLAAWGSAPPPWRGSPGSRSPRRDQGPPNGTKVPRTGSRPPLGWVLIPKCRSDIGMVSSSLLVERNGLIGAASERSVDNHLGTSPQSEPDKPMSLWPAWLESLRQHSQMKVV